MRNLSLGRTLLIAAMIAVFATIGLGSAAADPSLPPDAVRVVVGQNQFRTVVGHHFTYRVQVVNPGARPIDGVLAHLNVASLTTDVYVDPEDWSSSRSTVIAHLNPGARTSLSWDIQAVSAGRFAVYVVLLRTGAEAAGAAAAIVSPPAHVSVAERRTLNAGGSLPVVIAVPALLGVGFVVTRWRARRASH